MVKRKLDGAVDESSADHKFLQSDMQFFRVLQQTGWPADEILARLELPVDQNIDFSALFSQGTALFQQL